MLSVIVTGPSQSVQNVKDCDGLWQVLHNPQQVFFFGFWTQRFKANYFVALLSNYKTKKKHKNGGKGKFREGSTSPFLNSYFWPPPAQWNPETLHPTRIARERGWSPNVRRHCGRRAAGLCGCRARGEAKRRWAKKPSKINCATTNPVPIGGGWPSLWLSEGWRKELQGPKDKAEKSGSGS